MEKNLPRVYASPINKNINNNKEYYYQELEERKSPDSVDVLEKINKIFSSVHHVYKSHVKITTKSTTLDTYLVGKKNNSILTLDGNKIDIQEIIDIEKI